jgi:hypothetical protein
VQRWKGVELTKREELALTGVSRDCSRLHREGKAGGGRTGQGGQGEAGLWEYGVD